MKRLSQVFRPGSEYDAKVARIAVLYEDLRLENIAASESVISRLDASGVETRQFYFMRRSIATLREFAEALTMLDADPEFESIKAKFDATASARWRKAIRFFTRRDQDLKKIRNDFGGHFGYAPALFAVNNLGDGQVSFEYAEQAARRTGNVRFKFASEIVAIGMRRHGRAEDPHDHFRLMFRLALAGFGRAARCAQVLAVYDLWPRFAR